MHQLNKDFNKPIWGSSYAQRNLEWVLLFKMDKEYFFEKRDWKTVNSFDSNYSYPKNERGVYLLVKTEIDYEIKKINYEILYVGSSTKLKQRYETHEVLKMLLMNTSSFILDILIIT